ncbi:MAG: LamG domain-containing protein, partial [Verrucomicrobiaceae bacterium]
MKNLASFALLSVAGAISASAAISDNLVSYYDFEEAVSGNGSAIANRVSGGASATIFGTSPTSGFAGNAAFNSTGTDGAGNTSNRSALIVGKAANFTHTSTDAIRVPVDTTALWGSTPVAGAGFSISAWYFAAIDPNQAASQRYFVFEDGTNTTQFDVSFGSQAAAANATSLAMWAYNNGATGAAVQATSSVGAWHHVVHTFTYDGTSTLMSVYRDGVSTPATLNFAGFPSFTELNIGNARDGQSRGWDGMIDEVAVWSRALAPAEVQGVYNLGLQGEAVTALKFNVALSSSPESGGTVSGSGLYSAGQQATFSATPKPGYVFSSWDGVFNGQSASFSYTVNADITAVATFGEDTGDPDGDGLTNYEEIVIYGTG